MTEDEKRADAEKIKKINRRALWITLGLGIPYLIHLYLAYDSWGFMTRFFEGDVITMIIYAFVALIGLIVYATFIAFRKYL